MSNVPSLMKYVDNTVEVWWKVIQVY